MGKNLKMRSKRTTAFCAALLFLCAMVFALETHAAPPPITVTLEMEQVFTSPAGSSASGLFAYRLTALEAGNPMPASNEAGNEYVFYADGTASVTIGPITYAGGGTYSYKLEQVVCCAETGYTYDREIYTVTVYVRNVTDDPEDLLEEGRLEYEIVIQKSSGEKVAEIRYENSYTPLATDPASMSDPLIEKTVLGNPATAATFTFELRAADESYPMPAGSANGVKTVTVVGGGQTGTGNWVYTEAGVYVYTVSEVDSGTAGYTYDTAVYTITDNVEDTGGQLVLTRTMTDASGNEVSAFAFTNEYSAAGGKLASPQTGDDSMLGLYRAAMVISGAVLAACLVGLAMAIRRRKKRQ